MKTSKIVVASLFVTLSPFALFLSAAQETATTTAAPALSAASSVPTLMRFSGIAKDLDSKPLTGTIGITFLLYKDQQGGAPLWMETQNVQPDAAGHYTVQLGSTNTDGLPTDVFTSGEARWVAVQISGQAEQPRVRLLSVPYALKAADAATIGGLPPSAFVKATPTAAADSHIGASGSSIASGSTTNKLDVNPALFSVTTSGGTVGHLPLWKTNRDIESSVITQVGTGATAKTGIGTTTPGARLDVLGNDSSVQSAGMQITTPTFPQYIFNATSGGPNAKIWRMIGRGNNNFEIQTLNDLYAGEVTAMQINRSGTSITNVLFPNGDVGIGTTTPSTTLDVKGNNTFQPLRVESPNTFGTWIQLANTSPGGLTWFMLSAASGNSEGAGNLAFTNSNFNGSGTVFIHANLHVDGTVSKGGGSFRIDHPLDAANKYLSHSFVESPDMMNIYNGVVKLDAKGEAWVSLPQYFEALNRDFRYQLTSIGAPGPNLYIAQEIAGNRFRIKGGKPGAKVSWQVTGVRQDAYANAHRIPIEEDKTANERGYYLHPDAFGLPQSKAIAMTNGVQPTTNSSAAFAMPGDGQVSHFSK